MDVQFTTFGAIIGLVIAIILIIKKMQPAYCLILGALIGGLIGGGGLTGTVNTMVSGAGSMMSSVLRIITSGILAGALIKTGSAQKIAQTIVDRLGSKRAVAAIAIATMIICAVGVFIDISVITVAPIALAIGEEAGLSKSGVLLAMIGGGKAGNIISPNPNTIAVSEAFNVDLTAVMLENVIPAICALVVTIILAGFLTKKKGDAITASDLEAVNDSNLKRYYFPYIETCSAFRYEVMKSLFYRLNRRSQKKGSSKELPFFRSNSELVIFIFASLRGRPFPAPAFPCTCWCRPRG